ncbi:MAG: sulfatase-like hydrolase/transferase, partial [Phycisphaerae bacterium]
IHTAEPHAPYLPPPGFRGRFDADYSGPIDGSIQSMHQVQSERDIAHARALYDEEVLYADHRFGLFVDALSHARRLDDATILVTADHGEHLFEHGEWAGGHGVRHLFEEALRVPLIVCGPAVRARGPLDRPAQLLDVMPTILDLLGVAAPAALAGESLAPLLRAQPAGPGPARDIVTCALTQRKDVQRYVINESGRWKLICGRATTPGYVMDESVQKFELYDLKADPGEQRDVLREQPDVVRRLVAKLLSFKDQHRPYDVQAPPEQVEFDAKQLRELRSLGYVP